MAIICLSHLPDYNIPMFSLRQMYFSILIQQMYSMSQAELFHLFKKVYMSRSVFSIFNILECLIFKDFIIFTGNISGPPKKVLKSIHV